MGELLRRLWPCPETTQMNNLEAGPKLWKALGTYMELVCNYSKRQFPFEPDVLNGFAGIFAVLNEENFKGSIKNTTSYGIPSSIFIHALLWSPAARIPRRGTNFPTQNDFTTGNPAGLDSTAGRSGASRLVVVGYRLNLAVRA
ncbi:hypothetical protein CCHR01_18353 [Colletotrichum chrysophilum]|uniref:Uncharacterized protein n=1 Tax=Colletotrichum chrysophilum TaxID=1836956 RepID=A0AAD9E8Q9_9PEZI|nr:hypothetical protein CCHR01_18353 [Colletotrichum chrysophilum]